MSEQDGEVSVERGATAGGRIRAAIRQSIDDLDKPRICTVEQMRTVLADTRPRAEREPTTQCAWIVPVQPPSAVHGPSRPIATTATGRDATACG
ncbi:hypothetical protein [Burkholderia multivorans]|uniref:hypothetical protein n=1 Tax=Burkholderia multivorans TaxID=87883 RepID=UPI001B8E02C6|nr:hypothetical protein [Burkholderia multivorans]MBR8124628.1 hypothetical protein [Burkholderia multivorans]MBU9601100.1 hypothetical protein [Burkholderia multivorans]